MNKAELQILGRWQVSSATILPFEHMSFCTVLNLNSLFEFQENRTIKVYENENSKENCNQRQSFWIDSIGLNIHEYDFNFTYTILKLTNDSLVIQTTRIPSYFYRFDYKILDSAEEKNILSNGIQIRMHRFKNTN